MLNTHPRIHAEPTRTKTPCPENARYFSDSSELSSHDIHQMASLEQYLWAMYFEEFWQCSDCGHESGFREVHDIQKQIKIPLRVFQEKLNMPHQTCPCCQSPNGSLFRPLEMAIAQMRDRYKNDAWGVILYENNEVSGFTDGYKAPLSTVWDNEFAAYYDDHHQKKLGEDIGLSSTEESVLVWSAIGVDDTTRSLPTVMKLIRGFFSAMPDECISHSLFGETRSDCDFYPFVDASGAKLISIQEEGESAHDGCVIFTHDDPEEAFANMTNRRRIMGAYQNQKNNIQ